MRSEIKILRPLRTFDTKELVFYNSFNKLEPIYIKQPVDNSLNSVQNLMVKFVSDLKTSFPATVSTILRTSEKVARDDSGVSCKLCKVRIIKSSVISVVSKSVSDRGCDNLMEIFMVLRLF